MNLNKKSLLAIVLITIFIITACGNSEIGKKEKASSSEKTPSSEKAPSSEKTPSFKIVPSSKEVDKDNEYIENFPKGDNGYPSYNYILVNNEAIKLTNPIFGDDRANERIEVKVEEDKPMKLVLPKGDASTLWRLDERTAHLKSYLEKDMKVDEIIDGGSATLQVFEIFPLEKEARDKQIILKFLNVGELGKGFDDINETYKLIINVK